MSRNNTISIVLAAVTAALTVWTVPATATGGVLSERQVRALIRQEVAKIPRVRELQSRGHHSRSEWPECRFRGRGLLHPAVLNTVRRRGIRPTEPGKGRPHTASPPVRRPSRQGG